MINNLEQLPTESWLCSPGSRAAVIQPSHSGCEGDHPALRCCCCIPWEQRSSFPCSCPLQVRLHFSRTVCLWEVEFASITWFTVNNWSFLHFWTGVLILNTGIVIAWFYSYRAGSRYETAPNKGAAHVLRTSVGLGTKDVSAFAITRNIQQAGGSLTAESGREHVMYSLDMTRNNLWVF